MAAAYCDVIKESYECERCAAHPEEWERLGKCFGPIRDGIEQIPITWTTYKGEIRTAINPYPVEWTTCPRASTRVDLFPNELAVADIVMQANHAEIKHAWPEVPSRLWDLALLYETTLNERYRALREAQMSEI